MKLETETEMKSKNTPAITDYAIGATKDNEMKILQYRLQYDFKLPNKSRDLQMATAQKPAMNQPKNNFLGKLILHSQQISNKLGCRTNRNTIFFFQIPLRTPQFQLTPLVQCWTAAL